MYQTSSDDKLIDIKQWGTAQWTDFVNAYRGCTNLVGSATDSPNFTNATALNSTFRDCDSLNGNFVSNWDTSLVTAFNGTFRDSSVNVNCSNWDISSTTSVSNMLSNTNFNRSLADWNIVNVSAMTNFMNGVTTLSTANYNSTLVGWVATLDAYVLAGNSYSLTPAPNFGTVSINRKWVNCKEYFN